MFKDTLTYEDLHRAIEAVELYGSPKAAATVLGWTPEKLQHRINVARTEGMLPPAATRNYKPKQSQFGYKRHLFIPDTQIKPGVPLDHIRWAAQAIVDYKPDVIIVGGDWWDFPSLNGHEEPGSEELEGKRFKDDVDAGNAAFAMLCVPMEAEQARRGNRWFPRKVFIEGNHENRADRIARADPKWMGHVGSNHCNVRDFEWHPFLKVVEIDGVHYCHFFQNSHSSYSIGGTPQNRLAKIGASFVQGHVQGFEYGTKITPLGRTMHGVVAGSYYLHRENYKGNQGQQHWRGLIVLNEVRDGGFDIMPLSAGYLCRKFENEMLVDYMNKRYAGHDWSHLA